MDYLIAETFFDIYDSYNQKYAHTTDNTLKWRPLYYDFDISLTKSKANVFGMFFQEKYVRKAATLSQPAHVTNMSLYFAFYRNDDWMKAFFTRYVYVLNNIFTTDKMLSTFEDMKDSISSEMQRTLQRWGLPSSVNTWKSNVSQLEGYLKVRRGIVINQLKDLLLNRLQKQEDRLGDYTLPDITPD
jgi:hypothetical protein